MAWTTQCGERASRVYNEPVQYKKMGSRYVVRLDRGEEIAESIESLCRQEKISAGVIHGIGAVSRVEVSLFDPTTKQYKSRIFEGKYEMTSLQGNIALQDNQAYLHCHITFSDVGWRAYGGHLNSAIIGGTGEIMIEIIDGSLEREFNNDIGLNLLNW